VYTSHVRTTCSTGLIKWAIFVCVCGGGGRIYERRRSVNYPDAFLAHFIFHLRPVTVILTSSSFWHLINSYCENRCTINNRLIHWENLVFDPSAFYAWKSQLRVLAMKPAILIYFPWILRVPPGNFYKNNSKICRQILHTFRFIMLPVHATTN
jgi:hypothetical protein